MSSGVERSESAHPRESILDTTNSRDLGKAFPAALGTFLLVMVPLLFVGVGDEASGAIGIAAGFLAMAAVITRAVDDASGSRGQVLDFLWDACGWPSFFSQAVFWTLLFGGSGLGLLSVPVKAGIYLISVASLVLFTVMARRLHPGKRAGSAGLQPPRR